MYNGQCMHPLRKVVRPQVNKTNEKPKFKHKQ